MAYYFENVIYSLEEWGLTDVLLPFLLIFTVIFGILQKTRIFGEGKKNMNISIALVMALTVVIPHVTRSYPPGADAVEILNSALPQVSIIIVAVIMVLILIGLLGGEATWIGGSLSGWIAIASFLIIFFIFGRSAEWFYYLPSWLIWLDDPDLQALIIIILVFGVIIWYITKADVKGEQLSGISKISKGFGDIFKPSK